MADATKAERVIHFALADPYLAEVSRKKALSMISDFTPEQWEKLPEAWRAISQIAEEE